MRLGQLVGGCALAPARQPPRLGLGVVGRIESYPGPSWGPACQPIPNAPCLGVRGQELGGEAALEQAPPFQEGPCGLGFLWTRGLVPLPMSEA